MQMKFAFDTYREVAHGTPAQRRHALATFALWFIAGAYVTATLVPLLVPYEGIAAEVVGGAAVALAVATIKLT